MRPVMAKGVKSRGSHNLPFFGVFFRPRCLAGWGIVRFGCGTDWLWVSSPGPSVLSPGGISLLRPRMGWWDPFFFFFSLPFLCNVGGFLLSFHRRKERGGEKGRGAFFLLLLFATRAHSLSRRIFFCFRAESSSWAADAADAEDLSALLWRAEEAAKREVGESGKELPPLPPPFPSFGTKWNEEKKSWKKWKKA